jgi:hypothetical protein
MYHKDTKTYSKYGYADAKGKLVIDTIYDYAGNFTNGTAIVAVNGKAGMINTDNKVIFPLQYTSISKQQNVQNLLFVKNDTAWALITTGGKLLTGFIFKSVGSFKDGLASVVIGNKYGYIDTNGNLVVQAKYDFGGDYSSGRALVHVKAPGGKYNNIGYINSKGEEVIKPVYLSGTSFMEGCAAVFDLGGKFLIDSNGLRLTKLLYDEIGLMQNGRANFKRGTVVGFLNKRGEEVIGNGLTFGLLDVRPFADGLAAVKKGNLWGFVDTSGNFVVQPKYYRVRSFDMGIAPVALKLTYDSTSKKFYESWGFIDRTGKEITAFKYTYISDGTNGGFIVGVNSWYDTVRDTWIGGKKGLYTVNGEIIPPEYDYVSKFMDGKPYALASGNGKSYRFDIKGKLISQTN